MWEVIKNTTRKFFKEFSVSLKKNYIFFTVIAILIVSVFLMISLIEGDFSLFPKLILHFLFNTKIRYYVIVFIAIFIGSIIGSIIIKKYGAEESAKEIEKKMKKRPTGISRIFIIIFCILILLYAFYRMALGW